MDENIPREVELFINQHLTSDEMHQVLDQLRQTCVPNKQVLWTGMQREYAQAWADERGMQTLTTAMGPLMDVDHSLCPKKQKSPKRWSNYVHGASAIFAWLISKGESVTVLSRPPPVRFHPSDATSFQTIEQPIIKGTPGNKGVNYIRIVHPRVPNAADFSYQLWPEDGVATWVSAFGFVTCTDRWRNVKSSQPITDMRIRSILHSRGGMATPTSSQTKEGVTEPKLLAQGLGSSNSNHITAEHRMQRDRFHDEKVMEERVLRERHAQERSQLEGKAAEARNALRRKQSNDRQSLCEQHQEKRRAIENKDKKKRGEARRKEVEEQKQLSMKHRKEKRHLRACERADIVSLDKRHKQQLVTFQKRKGANHRTLAETQKIHFLSLKRENRQGQPDKWNDTLESQPSNTQATTGQPESSPEEIECFACGNNKPGQPSSNSLPSFMSQVEGRLWRVVDALLYLTRR